MNVLEETIKGFVKEGIEVTLVYDEKHGFGYNLNTTAKSELIVYPLNDNEVLCVGRYSEKTIKAENVEVLTIDLSYMVKDCMCGRFYISGLWTNYFDKHNIDYKQ